MNSFIFILTEYPPYEWAFQLALTVSINEVISPSKFWVLWPQNLFILLTSYEYTSKRIEWGHTVIAEYIKKLYPWLLRLRDYKCLIMS